MANPSIERPSRKDFERILPVLEKRLPYSCYMVNQLKSFMNLEMDMDMICLQRQSNPGETNSSVDGLWIIFKVYREDWNQLISISPPLAVTLGEQEIALEIQESLETSGVCDFSKPFVFITDQKVSDMLIRLNTRKLLNTIKVNPSHLFYMDPSEALKLEIPSHDSSIEFHSLKPGEADSFILSNWKWARQGSAQYIHKCLKNHLTGGLFVRGELVSAVIAPGSYGLAECLVTHPSHRRKGYASLLMKYMYREMARKGFQPSLDSEACATEAVLFHKTVNPRIVATIDFICHKALM